MMAPNNSVAVLDLATGKEMHKLTGHPMYAQGASFSPDERTLIVWTLDGTVHLWDPATGRKLRQFPFLQESKEPGPRGGYTSFQAALSPDGKLIAYGSIDSLFVLLEVATGKVIHRLTNVPDRVGPVAFSRDGRTVSWGGLSGFIGLVEVATGQQRYQFTGSHGQGGVTSLTFFSDGTRLLSGHDDTTGLVWDLTGELAAKGGGGGRLSPAELDACWAELAGQDASRAYQSVRKLAAVPAQAVPYLGKRLQPVAAVEPRRLARFIADLNSNQFAVRESATRELEKLEELAAPACRKALEKPPSEESRRRLERILEAHWQQFRNPVAERLRALRALEVLERAGTMAARETLEALAKGPPDARLTREAKASVERLAMRTPTKS